MTKENRIRNVLAKKDLKLERMQLYKGMQLPSKIWNERKPINSTATAFYSLYRVELKNAGKEKHHMRKRTDCLTKRQITFIGMDRMVQRSILLTLSGGGLITSAVAIAIAPNPLLILSHRSRTQLTGKVKLSKGARQETELLYLREIVSLIRERSIPASVMMNLDQTLPTSAALQVLL